MINVAVVGFGNLGKSVVNSVNANEDLNLFGVFSRRKIENENVKHFLLDEINNFKDDIDVLILCGSSDKDIEVQGPELIKNFNTVDCFDTHSHVPEYYKNMDDLAKENNKTAIISTGWDPGFFSVMRTLNQAFLPDSNTYTIWGKGISQGHGAAVRSVEGVLDAVQYTIPKEEFLEKVRNGENPEYSPEIAHDREVFAVLKEGANKEEVEKNIINMPAYFKGYNTTVHFITLEELNKNHKGMPHGGKVITTGITAGNSNAKIEFSLDLDSNPDFTAQIATAYARACFRLNKEKNFGAKTVLDIAPKYLSKLNNEELLHHNI
ncbi:MAG: diaminopimelate dehydrogenase [Peptoniphilaceae bacterium]|nr:diaminopimelate dehydrogenase [Peptoniphilaceae bacterium]MDD7383656.1 diaminopimelate dehydrogenase [Peptoniphilaceae bacterium]MDY3737827.1 diaminopimelate dehydrogenase [Peptoniphilaceae bacterium]